MEKLRQIFIMLALFLVGFFGTNALIESSIYLLNQPNTIANFFGSIIFITTFVVIILLGYKAVKSLNK